MQMKEDGPDRSVSNNKFSSENVVVRYILMCVIIDDKMRTLFPVVNANLLSKLSFNFQKENLCIWTEQSPLCSG